MCTRWIVAVLAVISTVCAAYAQDVLELRNGTIVRGRFLGGTAETVRFEGERGLEVFQRSELIALTFSGSAAAAPPIETVSAPPPAPPPAPAPPPRPSRVTLPSGTMLIVRMDSTISTRNSREGERFQATLAHDLEAGGIVVAPAGTPVLGRVNRLEQAGRLAGRSELRLQLREINLNGTLVPIRTGNFSETGQSSFRGTARNAGLGAGIGAAFGGGEGAARGAAIGGATAVLREGNAITIPAGAILEFRLQDALVVTP